jgi:RNA polymerase sigma-70 factor (ECF subfamily)
MSGVSPDPEFSPALIALLPRLRRYARVLTRDGSAADDLVQDTLERAWSRHRQWRPGSDLRAWLFSIMHNRHVDLVRSTVLHPDGHRSPSPEDDDANVGAAQAPAAPSLEAIDLQRCFERLSDEHRQVLLLIAVEQMRYAEAAESLGVPVGTVMSRLSRARASLRHELAGGAPAPATRLTRIK